ncbi:DUF4845 domain-containing protein [Aestuariirhabdus sp. Z084]|uniref:DUF4845 domain-containing protein n=1 Tax=Aestuariirhabdus haliotis TaxID=2918751 RepID=UPI00201B3B64|nr:DUF4845 domain-containing protein [Aestuariirhabdus haliotis]MCL6417151.1 DUF4845 domain-containing protein [Aestuariirhabdus haliotis]MCL6421117.1 DUF4845 domain-containing protein [Aestuariirhabdus haliotis]
MKFANSQRGMSTAGWMMTLAVAGMTLLLVFKMVPFYLDDQAIGQTLENLSARKGIDEASPREIRGFINKNFQTNMIRDFDKEDIEIYEEDGFLKVDIEYEKRVHIVSNVDVVMSFKHNWQVKNQ